MKTVQFIIDPQKDFIIAPNFKGALGVDGAYEDMLRLAKHIESSNPESIVITLDTHAKIDIAHKAWWVDNEGNNPGDYTIITYQDIINKKWKSKDSSFQEYSIFYLKQLEENNKYKLMIWPDHCIKGSIGHQVNDELLSVIKNWENKNKKEVIYVNKGENPKTEHYSGLKAEVELKEDKKTQLNKELINYLNTFDKIEISGEAISHCVGSTVIDLLSNLKELDRKKVTILTDCTSPVGGFEKQGNDFLEKAYEMGANLKESKMIKKYTI